MVFAWGKLHWVLFFKVDIMIQIDLGTIMFVTAAPQAKSHTWYNLQSTYNSKAAAAAAYPGSSSSSPQTYSRRIQHNRSYTTAAAVQKRRTVHRPTYKRGTLLCSPVTCDTPKYKRLQVHPIFDRPILRNRRFSSVIGRLERLTALLSKIQRCSVRYNVLLTQHMTQSAARRGIRRLKVQQYSSTSTESSKTRLMSNAHNTAAEQTDVHTLHDTEYQAQHELNCVRYILLRHTRTYSGTERTLSTNIQSRAPTYTRVPYH